MRNEFLKNKQGNRLIVFITLILFVITGLFCGYAFQRKNANALEMNNLEDDIAGLKQKINIIERKGSAEGSDCQYLKTFQIYNLIEESANNSQMTLKSFSQDKKTGYLGVSLIGNFPNAVSFFTYLVQARFTLIQEIEMKNNSQDPQKSIEILLKIIVPTGKGA
ncbi:MAG TPA: hypothetical protein DDW65_12735 [Firmicutes bacterium]|jgi:hypothetical protein|nr:hypothetical protein [Bacillota bacterium]